MILAGVIAMAMSAPALANSAIERALEQAIQKSGSCLDGISQVESIGDRYFVTYSAYGSYDSASGECSGNGTWAGLAELSNNNSGRYSVKRIKLHEAAEIDNMSVSDDGIATLTTREYGRSDSQHSPSDVHKVRIRLIDGKVLSNNFSGRQKSSNDNEADMEECIYCEEE